MRGRRLLFKICAGTALFCICIITWRSINQIPQLHVKSEFQTQGLQTLDKIVINKQTIAIEDNDKFNKAVFLNFQQEFHNSDKFGEHSDGDDIIVVQLEMNNILFKEFLHSLRQAQGINKATLVISVNGFSDELQQLIFGIDFCRYTTIFFPYSMHFFNSYFPGQDKNDCPRDMPKSQALLNQCNNADYPDMYGHYREAKYAQMKHHWFWQLFMVFKGIRAFSSYQSPVLFLEGSHFVLPDFLHCARKALEQRASLCSDCLFINLGNYQIAQNYEWDSQAEICSWTGAKSSLGLIITPELFEIISSVSDTFCEFDDYNWALSLQYSLLTKRPGKYLTLQLKASRVFHLEACNGMKKNCEVKDEIEHIKAKYEGKSLFPGILSTSSDPYFPSQIPRPNGGWGDIRDHILCKSYKRNSKI